MASIEDGDNDKIESFNDISNVNEARSQENRDDNDSSKILIGYQIFKTVALGCIFLVMGLSSPTLGTSYVHLEKIFHIDAQTVSMAMVIASVGYLTGAIICALVYDRIMPELSFAVVNALGAVFAFAAFAASCYSNFPVFETAMFFHEVTFGFDDAAGQSYCVNIWDGHRLQKPLLQGMHSVWSLGGIFGPMFVKLFLCELEIKDHGNQTTLSPSIENVTSVLGIDSGQTEECVDGNIETTRYAFMAMGVSALIANIPFSMLCLKGLAKKLKIRTERGATPPLREVNTTQTLIADSADTDVEIRIVEPIGNMKERSLGFTVVHVIFIMVFTMLNLCSEFLPIMFLVSFALKHLGWSVSLSSLLLSVYFGAHFAGRIAGIFNSMWLSPAKMIFVNLILTSVAHLFMLLVNDWPGIIWFSVILAGFNISAIFPTNVLWISETTPVTGKIGAIMVIGMCSSTITSPYVVASLTTNLGQMWFIYILIIGSHAHIIVFILEACFIRFFS